MPEPLAGAMRILRCLMIVSMTMRDCVWVLCVRPEQTAVNVAKMMDFNAVVYGYGVTPSKPSVVSNGDAGYVTTRGTP